MLLFLLFFVCYYYRCFFFSHIHLGCHLKQLASNWWQYSFQVSIWCLFFSYENQKNINACACYSCATSLIWKQMNYCLFWVGQVIVHPTGSWTSYKYTCNTTCSCFTTLNRRFCEDKMPTHSASLKYTTAVDLKGAYYLMDRPTKKA